MAPQKLRELGTGHYIAAEGGGGDGGRAANFEWRVTIFLTRIWGGPPFFNLDLGEGYAFLSLYILSKSQ